MRASKLGTKRMDKTNGYVMVRVEGDGVGKRWKAEHLLVMEEHIGRRIAKGEVVHHINHIKTDNRLENLQLQTRGQHLKEHEPDHKNNFRVPGRGGYLHG